MNSKSKKKLLKNYQDSDKSKRENSDPRLKVNKVADF